LRRLDDEFDAVMADDLLYQLAVDVNPSLEIHQVSIPVPELAGDDVGEEAGRTGKERREFQRRVQTLEREIKKTIVGQDQAIASLARAVKKAAVGLKRAISPIGTFFLVGRTGTGKTEIAKVLSQALFEGPGRLVRVDCSEYALPHEYAKLIGSPPGYIGHSEGGVLTEAVKKRKGCVVLFDEIEKAHYKVHNLLLQILDEGHLTDSKGVTVPFNRTVIILTSNLGIEKIEQYRSRMGFDTKKREAMPVDSLRQLTIDALKESFRPEFVNRIDEVVVFNPLDLEVCCRIADRMLNEVCDLLLQKQILVRFSPGVKRWLAKHGFSEEYGARELRRLVKRSIEDPLTERILREDLGPGTEFAVRLRGQELQIETKTSARGAALWL
jgi:ATP-dependent Clp protease ATP-binding subunit ClpC